MIGIPLSPNRPTRICRTKRIRDDELPLALRVRTWGSESDCTCSEPWPSLAHFCCSLSLPPVRPAGTTSRPQFCNSCHIMEPYYRSWQVSSHSNVSCTKCHFPPGAGEKVRGKLLGLVQL